MEPLYKTSDFWIICVLVAMDFKVKKIDSDPYNTRIKHFSFQETDELYDILLKHSNGELEVNTLTFTNAIDNVKRMINL